MLPPNERTAAAILKALDFDFFELLDAVTIARSRKHIETFYDTKDIGKFPQRRKPLSFQCPITHRTDVMGLNDIFAQPVGAEARGLRPDQLHPAEPPSEVRRDLRHPGRRAVAASCGRLTASAAFRR